MTEDLIVKVLAGEAEDHEVSLVKNWANENAENKKVFSEISKLWNASKEEVSPSKFDANAAWNKLDSRLGSEKKTFNIRTYWAVAASLAILMGLALLFRTRPEKIIEPQLVEIQTTQGQKTVNMPDGSEIVLQNGSLAYSKEFNAQNRKMSFNKGKAFFKIKSDSAHPFVIHCQGIDVTVMGTAFEINSDSIGTRVSVLEGRVRVRGGDRERLLTGGMSIQYRNRAKELDEIQSSRGEQFLYATGSLIFDKIALEDVQTRLEEAFPGLEISLPEHLMKCRYTSNFEMSERPENIMRVVALSFGAEVKIDETGKYIEVVGGACQP